MGRIIRIAVSLYPRPWHERYGSEFPALLEDVGPGSRTAWNVFAGAVAMRLRTLCYHRILAISVMLACGAYVVDLRRPNIYRSNGMFVLEGPETKSARNDVVQI